MHFSDVTTGSRTGGFMGKRQMAGVRGTPSSMLVCGCTATEYMPSFSRFAYSSNQRSMPSQAPAHRGAAGVINMSWLEAVGEDLKQKLSKTLYEWGAGEVMSPEAGLAAMHLRLEQNFGLHLQHQVGFSAIAAPHLAARWPARRRTPCRAGQSDDAFFFVWLFQSRDGCPAPGCSSAGTASHALRLSARHAFTMPLPQSTTSSFFRLKEPAQSRGQNRSEHVTL